MSSGAYPVINNVPCIPETEVAFKTHNKTDKQTYRGRILGCVNYDIAKNFGDIIAIHNDMSASVAKTEPAVQTYLLIETADGAKRPFATNWIDALTFKSTDAASDQVVVIHSVTQAELARVLTTVRDLGFDVTISS